MRTKIVRRTIAILATIVMLIFLAIVGSLLEEGQNIIARVLWILATVLISAALLLRLQECCLEAEVVDKAKAIGRRNRD